MTTLRDLPPDHYVIAELGHTTSAAVPHDDPLAPLARRWLHGKRGSGDREAIEAWLEAHPQYRITRLPADEALVPVVLPPRGQLTLWEAA
jgi:hypothetical protein